MTETAMPGTTAVVAAETSTEVAAAAAAVVAETALMTEAAEARKGADLAKVNGMQPLEMNCDGYGLLIMLVWFE